MTKGRLSTESNSKQERIEDALAGLGVALALLQHDTLRVMQILRRGEGLHDLAGCVIEDLARVREEIRAAQSILREEWERGQKTNWKE